LETHFIVNMQNKKNRKISKNIKFEMKIGSARSVKMLLKK